MAKNVVTGQNELKAKNIIMADKVVVNENEAKDGKKKDWSKSILAAVLIPLLGVGAAVFAIFYEKPKIFLYNPPLDQAEIALVNGDYPEAIAKFNEATAIEADNPRIWLGMYAAQEISGSHEEAIQALRQGETQVRRRATGGKEIRAALKAAENSPEEGLAEVAKSYRSFELKPLALKFLQLLVRVFPDSERFARMLAELEAELEPEAQAVNAEQPNESTTEEETVPAEAPESVFGMKDIQELGLSLDSDIYAIADRLGIPRDRVFEEDWREVIHRDDFVLPKHVPFIIFDSSTGGDGSWNIRWELDDGGGWSIGQIGIGENLLWFRFSDRAIYTRFISERLVNEEHHLIRGIGFGTRGEDVLRSFYNSEEYVVIEDGEPKLVNIYNTDNTGFPLYYFREQPGKPSGDYNKPRDQIGELGYTLEYEFEDTSTNIEYTLEYTIIEGIVVSMSWHMGRNT